MLRNFICYMKNKKVEARMEKSKFDILDYSKSLCRQNHLMQYIKFGGVGVLNVLIGYTIYLGLIYFDVNYLFANVTGFSLSMINAYYWNNKYVFASSEERAWWKVFAKMYMAYALTGIVIGNILLYVWIEIFQISAFLAPLISLFVTFPINYIMNKYWAF